MGSIKAAHNRHSFRCDGYARLNERVFLENPLYLLYHRLVTTVATSGFKILRLLPENSLYLLYHRFWNGRLRWFFCAAEKEGRISSPSKTLHIYYTTGWQLQSSERLNNALHLLYPVDCDLFRPRVYCTTGLPTINPIYLLYHRLAIWWHVHYTAGWQTFSWCIHLTTEMTRVPPERLNDALHLLYHRVTITVPPERLNNAPLVSYHRVTIIEF